MTITMEDIFHEIPLINFFASSLTKSRLLKYFLITTFALYTPTSILWIFLQLNQENRDCYTEIIATVIVVCLYTVVTNLGGSHFLLTGRRKLKKSSTKINVMIKNLQLYFQTNITFHRQRQVANGCIILCTVASLFIFANIIGVAIFDPKLSKSGIFMFLLFIAGGVLTSFQAGWIWLLTFTQLILISILVNQIQGMCRVERKWHYRYAQLCLDIFQQSSLLNQVFGHINLVFIYTNFGAMILTMWSAAMEPNATCMMAYFQYTFFICCLWSIVIIESGERPNREVSLNLHY